MNLRMEKYKNNSLENMSRSERNKDIYKSMDMDDFSRIKTNNNVSVISDASEDIDLEKIKRYINATNDEHEEKRTRLSLELEEEPKNEVVRREERTYDINSVLEKARDNRESDYEIERHRKISNTQYDILKSIKIESDNVETDPDVTGPIEELNTNEQTIVDLIQTISMNSKKETSEKNKEDLFKDLIGDGDTIVMAPITDETNNNAIKEALENITQDLEAIKQPVNDYTQDIILEKEKLKEEANKEIDNKESEDVDTKSIKIDKSFFTNSMTFSKKDFEGFEDIENDIKKNNILTKIIIAFVILLLISIIFVILNYVLDLNII